VQRTLLISNQPKKKNAQILFIDHLQGGLELDLQHTVVINIFFFIQKPSLSEGRKGTEDEKKTTTRQFIDNGSFH
jgi:hypothetical protein